MSNYEFCINLLKKIYKKDFVISKENKYEIFIRENPYNIETKYEIKKTLRNILSSNNKNIDKDIVSLIEVKYKMDKKELTLLNEFYPNIDVFISAYMNNSNHIVKIKEYNYDKLLEYFIKSTVEQLENNELKKEYIELNEELKKYEKRLSYLKEKLEKYQIAQKSSFYYEVYRNYLFDEMENYNEERNIVITSIEKYKQNIIKLKKQYQKIEMLNQISKKTNIKRINKLNEISNEIEYLENRIKDEELTLEQLEKNNKKNIKRNNMAFKEYANMNINEYSLIYEQHKNVDGIKIINEIKELESKIKIILDKISNSEYPIRYHKLKYFLNENLKSFKKVTDLNPKISINIIKILENKNN